MKRTYLKCLLLVGMVSVLNGCTLAPQYHRPEAPVPAVWPNGAASRETRTAINASNAFDIGWQEFFSDKKLRQVIGMALTNNRDLRLSALNVERARAIYGIQRGELLPAVKAVGSGSKQGVPADLSSTGERTTSERYDVNLGVASWEIDFFGRIRSLKDRALEEYLATEQARRGAQILLVSSVANAYLTLAADREKLTLAKTTLTAQRDSYNMIKRRRDLGLATEVDLYRSQTQVDTARGDVARFVQQVVLDKNALNLLVGSPVANEILPTKLADVIPLEEISPDISSEVLLRRPDVLQAENLLRAAHADIGAARASLFPRISLTAAIGTASSELSGLFQSGQNAWSYAPQITMPIFDTRTWSALKATKVQREIVLAQYEKAIQNAFKEVADALAIRGTVNQQVSAQQSLVHAVTETYRLSNSRYERGIDGYLSVLDAQRSLFKAQEGLVSLGLAKLANTVRLYAVLGGGWNTSNTSDVKTGNP
jgi:outer membrane protein, multidrug efflux system